MSWNSCPNYLSYPTVNAATQADKKFDKMDHQSVNVTTLLKLNNNDAREFLCGWGAAVINVTVTYPVNKIIFRQVTDLLIIVLNE